MRLEPQARDTGGTLKITVTAERPQNDQVSAKVTVPAEDVDKAVAKTYKDIANKYAFQGFRRGHAPRPIIDNIVGREAVLAEATNDLLNDLQPLMIEELDVVPVEQPNFGDDVQPVVEHEEYAIDVTITVPPTCELDSYDAPAIEMPPAEATEAEIDEQVNQLMGYHATLEDDEDDRPAAKDDFVVADVEAEGDAEGAAKALVGTDRTFSLSANYLPEQFVEGVAGMKKGDEKEISWTDGEGDDAQTTSVKVTLKGIKKMVTPELTDEFCKKNYGYDTVADLRDAVKSEIEADKKSSLPTLKEDRVVEEVGKHLTLEEVPEAYVNQVFNEIAQDFLGRLQRQGLTLDAYLGARGIKGEDFVADLHDQAGERARQSLALDALAAKLGFEATEEDIASEFEKAGAQDVKSLVDQYTKAGQMPAIRESIRRTKAVNWLVENATVTEVDEAAKRAEETDGDEAEPAAKDDAPAEDSAE